MSEILLKKDNAYIRANETLAQELRLLGYEVVEEHEETKTTRTNRSRE
ncbi:hypothetical protein V7101_21320 [Bacillus velezensis]